MKYFVSFLLLLAVTLAATVGCKRPSQTTLDESQAKNSAVVDTTALIVMQISRQARLYTSACQVHKVLLYTDDRHLGGKFLGQNFDVKVSMGERKIAVPIDVTLKGAVDFSDFGPQNVEFIDSTLVITLPDPEVTLTSSRIDHKGVRQFVGIARSKFSQDEVTKLARQGEDSIAAHLDRYGIQEHTRKSMVRQLMPLLEAMGYDERHVLIRFRKNFTESELMRFVHLDRPNT